MLMLLIETLKNNLQVNANYEDGDGYQQNQYQIGYN